MKTVSLCTKYTILPYVKGDILVEPLSLGFQLQFDVTIHLNTGASRQNFIELLIRFYLFSRSGGESVAARYVFNVQITIFILNNDSVNK